MKIEFLDAQGKVIRTFTGTPAEAERKPPAPTATTTGSAASAGTASAGRGGHEPVHVGHALPGRDRFSRADHVGGAARAGPLAPPGTYQVRVTADGETATQAFTIRREPRLLKDVTDQDLQRAVRSRDARSATRSARRTRRCC